MRGRLLILGALCLALVLPQWLAAQTTSGENKLLALMPELRKLPSPDWVKEGARVTYYGAAASLPADRFYYYKDEHGLPQRGDEVGPAGGGFTQYTVVARTAASVIGVLENFAQDVGTGTLVPAPGAGSIDPAGAGACWANPAALAKADRFQSDFLLVQKSPYPLGGQTFKSVRFHYVSETSVLDSVYDLDSGLLLFFGSAVLSGDRRHTQLTQMTFCGRRQLALMAGQPDLPGWVNQQKQLQYRGQLLVLMPGMPTFPMPMALTLSKSDGGARWAKYQVATQAQGQPPGTLDLYCGAAQLLGEPFMSPQVLAELQPGQVIDEDPQMRVTVRVESVGPQAGVQNLVVISQSGKGFVRLRGYERDSGRLLLVQTDQQVGTATHRTQLQLAGG